MTFTYECRQDRQDFDCPPTTAAASRWSVSFLSTSARTELSSGPVNTEARPQSTERSRETPGRRRSALFHATSCPPAISRQTS